MREAGVQTPSFVCGYPVVPALFVVHLTSQLVSHVLGKQFG